MFGKDYAFTTYELKPVYEKFRESLESYHRYIGELKRFGNSGQVEVATNLNQWLLQIYGLFQLQYEHAERIQRETRDLLLIEDTKSDMFKSFDEDLTAELQRLVQNENRIYYEAGWYMMPVIDGLEQSLYHQFRSAIGLDVTAYMAKVINKLPEVSKRKPESEYKENKFPFWFARSRSFLSPTLKVGGEDRFMKDIDEVLQVQVKMKFMSLVIENDEYLQETLTKRKSADRKNG